MKEFVMIYRSETVPQINLNPDGMLAVSKKWENWMGSLAAQNKLAGGARLGNQGKTVSPANLITDGPYAEIKEIISGFSIINAESIEEAAEIAKGCPILEIGGCVEVRDLVPMND